MFGWISRAIGWAVNSLPNDIVHWVGDLINGVYGFFHTVAGLVGAAWVIFYANLKDDIDSATSFVRDVVHFATWLIDVWWPAIWKTIVTDIWDPLKKAVAWIAKEGAYMYHLLTHATDLVEFFWDALIAYLEKEAWSVGDKLGEFFLALVVKNLTKFLKLIEDIIDAVI